MVVPLLLTNVAICGLVSHAILLVLPSWLETLKSESNGIEVGALLKTASLRASFSQAVMIEPIRDLHLFTRVIGWILFGGIHLTDSVASVQSGTEECKYWEFGQCPVYQDSHLCPCSCEWRDPRPLRCRDYMSDARYLQSGFFCGQSSDVDPKTGNRHNVSYPLHSTSPNQTSWWTDIFELPGAEQGWSPVGGYKTAFDRVVASAASTVISVPLYNYIETLGRSKHFLGAHLAYQNDGMFTGYSGCSFEHREMAKFQSTVDNKANEFGGDELCPLGKWGFDPRCRGWYAKGLDHAKQGGTVHITAPYLFASGVEVASSATSAIFDPATGQHVGQTLLDFTPRGLFGNLVNTNAEISVVVSPVSDASGGDTVVGPNYDAGADPAPVGDVVLPYDSRDSTNRRDFDENIVKQMKSGALGSKHFTRTEEGGKQQKYVMAYAPITLRTLNVPRPDDYTEGVTNLTEFVFSLGVARLNENLNAPFQEIQDDVKKELHSLLLLYLCLVVVLIVCLSVCTSMVSSMTRFLVVVFSRGIVSPRFASPLRSLLPSQSP
jgi:hypothetical protein